MLFSKYLIYIWEIMRKLGNHMPSTKTPNQLQPMKLRSKLTFFRILQQLDSEDRFGSPGDNKMLQIQFNFNVSRNITDRRDLSTVFLAKH